MERDVKNGTKSYVSDAEMERRKIIQGNSDYLKMLEAIAALEEACVLTGEVSKRSDVLILAQPQLNMIYNEIATATRFLESIDWGTFKDK